MIWQNIYFSPYTLQIIDIGSLQFLKLKEKINLVQNFVFLISWPLVWEMLHVCGVAAKTSTLKILYYLKMWKMWGKQEILVFYEWKNRMGVAILYFGH
jgi:hypothetical protein